MDLELLISWRFPMTSNKRQWPENQVKIITKLIDMVENAFNVVSFFKFPYFLSRRS